MNDQNNLKSKMNSQDSFLSWVNNRPYQSEKVFQIASAHNIRYAIDFFRSVLQKEKLENRRRSMQFLIECAIRDYDFYNHLLKMLSDYFQKLFEANGNKGTVIKEDIENGIGIFPKKFNSNVPFKDMKLEEIRTNWMWLLVGNTPEEYFHNFFPDDDKDGMHSKDFSAVLNNCRTYLRNEIKGRVNLDIEDIVDSRSKGFIRTFASILFLARLITELRKEVFEEFFPEEVSQAHRFLLAEDKKILRNKVESEFYQRLNDLLNAHAEL